MENRENSVLARLASFQEKEAIFKTKEGRKYFWPIKDLPEDLKIGDEIRLSLSTAKTAEEEREKIAKEVLNQLLK
ncbi:MAG: hypothetical protein U5L76_04565 [Patescibacteria group bacterium]|nr:hypothetical protein [Patescibacteria group bacterium]